MGPIMHFNMHHGIATLHVLIAILHDAFCTLRITKYGGNDVVYQGVINNQSGPKAPRIAEQHAKSIDQSDELLKR